MGRMKGPTRAALLALSLLWANQTSGATFQGLSDLPGPSFSSEANGLSGDGSVIVGRANNSAGANEAFRWTSATGMQGIGSPYASSAARGISTDASVIVGDGGARWTSATGMQALAGAGNALAVSGDGSLIVGGDSAGLAYRWTSAGGKQSLGDFSGGTTESRANAVSADGSIVVGWGQNSNGLVPFRWTAATGLQLLPDLPGGGVGGDARGITPDGSVIVGFSGGPTGGEAARWTSSGVESLGTLGGGSPLMAVGLGVSADGETVVGYSRRGTGGIPSTITEPFIWDEVHGMRNLQTVLTSELGLDLTGWTLNEARAISLDGSTIVGVGVNPAGRSEAWMAVIPEPSSFALLPAAALALCRRGKQRRKARGHS